MKPTLRETMLAGVVTVAVIAGYTWHAQSIGRLEGEIKARGESIEQLGQLAARSSQGYQDAEKAVRYNATRYTALRDSVLKAGTNVPISGTLIRRAFTTADSVVASCSQALTSCARRDSVRLAQIDLLKKQVESFHKLQRSQKLFGFLPRPTVIGGYCAMLNAQGVCIAAGFPILK